MSISIPTVEAQAVQTLLATHLPIYRSKVPHYQTDMLNSLAELWAGSHESLLDIGGGTGVIAEAISKFLPVANVQSVDLVDRFCPSLSIATQQYDGRQLPFPDQHFSAATMNNVLHHVPVTERVSLLREIRRVVEGPLYIKDHATTGWLDDARLTALDAIGNIPFGGMIKASYLSHQDWEDLAQASGWVISAFAKLRAYRNGLMAVAFPNRLEITIRFDPA